MLGLVDQPVGHLHAGQRLLAQMRGDAVRVVLQGENAAQLPEIGGSCGSEAEFAGERLGFERGEIVDVGRQAWRFSITQHRAKAGFETFGGFAILRAGDAVGNLDAARMQFVGDRQVVERNADARGPLFVFRLAFRQELIQQRSEVTVCARAYVGLLPAVVRDRRLAMAG